MQQQGFVFEKIFFAVEPGIRAGYIFWASTPATGQLMDVQRYQLDNGLTVILQQQRTAPVVACNVWVGVGSADEEPHEAGLAHVHEHMLFKGTQRRGVGEIAREVESAGGHINAFTSFDQTCYYVVMSSRFFASGIDILSDAIRNSAFEAEELSRELEVIQEEIKRGKDDPGRVASRMLFETAYKTHPYRLPVIGSKESVDSFTRDHVVTFFRKHYVPDNMTLVLVGDFDEDEARALVDKHFADFEAPQHTDVERVAEPSQRGARVTIQSKDVNDSQLRLGFHIPDVLHDDIPAVDLLGAVMGFGEASHLYQTIQRDRELVNSIYAGSYTPKDAGLFVVGAEYQLDDEMSHPDIAEALLTEAFRFRSMRVADADLARARTIIESREIYSKQTAEGLAMKLGRSFMVTGDPDFDERYYQALARVTPDDVRRVARTYLTEENCSLCLLYPEGEEAPDSADLQSRIGRALETIASESVDAGIQPNDDGLVLIDLPDGPRLVVQEDHAVETFAMRGLSLGGLRYETAANNGVSSLLSNLLTRGTSSRDAVEIARSVEAMASGLSGMSGRNSFGLSMTGLSRFFQPCFEIFADCLVDAVVPADEFERERRLQLQNIRSREDRLGAVNYDRFASSFFGEHPYSMPTLGTAESLAGLDADIAREFLRKTLRADDMVLCVVGDVDAGEVVDMVERFLVRPHDDDAWTPSIPEPPTGRGRELVVGDLEREQAFVTVGFESPSIGEEARYTMEVLYAILSGQGGRLFYELRDRQSLAYSVYASMVLGLDAGAFTVNIGTSPEKVEQAVAGIFAEMKRLTSEPPTDEEMSRAKRYLIGNHDISLQRNSSRAMSFALDELYGFGYRKTFDYSDRIDQVSGDDIGRFVSEYLDASGATVAITKPGEVDVDLDW